jgi:hypothetical protein
VTARRIKHIVEPRKLLLLWQKPGESRRRVVGEIERNLNERPAGEVPTELALTNLRIVADLIFRKLASTNRC